MSLVPELYVNDLDASLRFYVDLCGFAVEYARPAERFAFLARGAAQLMLEEPIGRTFLAGPLDRPFGRGVNFQIAVDDVATLYQRCVAARATFVLPLERRSYRVGDADVGCEQFVVQDPDGYLLRFAQGMPPASDDGARSGESSRTIRSGADQTAP